MQDKDDAKWKPNSKGRREGGIKREEKEKEREYSIIIFSEKSKETLIL